MCSPKPPKPPPMPSMPTPISPEMIDQAAIDTKNRERRRAQTRSGQASTVLAGAGMPPTSQAKTLLGA